MQRGLAAGRGVLAAAGAMLIVSACATVSQDDFDAEMAQVRQEMRQQNEALEQRLGQRIDGVEGRLGSLENDLNALREDYDVTVERLEGAVRFNAPVHFAFDDATVRPQDQPLLDRFAEVIQSYYPEATITVEGFTDPAGDPNYNLRLGTARAEAVRDYLAGTGLMSDRMRVVSYGETRERQIIPGAQGPGTEGWQNRRVAMVIDFDPATADPPRVAQDSDEAW
jgi:peptidoglycan-associated lipoprotein